MSAPAGTSGRAGARLSRESRREQLLDSAAALLLERGPAAMTMEGIAARAGVSKALPYAHFDNADTVLVALYRREVASIGRRVATAVATEPDPPGKLRAAIHAYFETVRERGAILSILAGRGSTVPALAAGGERAGHRFVERLYREAFGVPEEAARVDVDILLGALDGGVTAIALGDGTQEAVEEAVVQVTLALVRRHARGGAAG